MFDVVVVGAGFSGLQAARSAQQAGLSVAVVEARDRVGGKSWTIPMSNGRGNADLGAAWVNDKLQRRVWSYIEQFGLVDQIVKQRLGATAVMIDEDGTRSEFPQGIAPDFESEEKKAFERIRDHIQAESLKPNGLRVEDDIMSLDQYIRKLGGGRKTLNMANLWVRVMHGVESTEESAAWFIDYCRTNRGLLAIRADDETGGNYMRIKTGTQSIAKGIAKLVGEGNIFLGNPVATIEDNKSHTLVRCTTGKAFKARKVIISIPSTMYKELNFLPGLPQRLREVTNRTKLGHYNKAIVMYDRPWWRDLGFNGFILSYQGPACVVRDTSLDEAKAYGFTCFVNGKPGEAWTKLHPHERRKAILDQLAKAFNVGPEHEVYRPMEFIEQVWQHEEFSRGALAPVSAIGDYTEYADVYGKPVGNLYFVGTEYARDWKGYMEGALASGEVGAQEAIESIQHGPTKSRL